MFISELLQFAMEEWEKAFPQSRTKLLAIRIALGMVLSPGRKTISQAIVFAGMQDQDRSSHYKVASL